MAVGLRTKFEIDKQEPEAASVRLPQHDAAYPGAN